MNDSRSLKFFRLWTQLANALAARVCNFVEASDSGDDLRAPCQDTRWHIERAQHWSRIRRRALRRADEALARVSPLRVSGGAS